MVKKTSWYAEYDRLFVKKQSQQKRQINRATVIVVILAALMPQSLRLWPQVVTQIKVQQRRRATQTTPPRKFVDNYVLKTAGLSRTAPVDQTRNLVVTLKDHDVTFSNGYHLAVNPKLRVSETVNDHIVTPTEASGDFPRTIADFTGKMDQDYVYGCLQLYANLIADFNADGDANALNLVKVFKQKTIGAAQTGYVFDIPNAKENRSYLRLTRYFLFADGTGVVVKTMPGIDTNTKKLNRHSRFKDFQAACRVDFDSLAKDYTMTAPISN